MQINAEYHGGLTFAPQPGKGMLDVSEESFELGRPFGKPPIVSVAVNAIESIEITSEQAAKSRVKFVVAFGVVGLGARGTEDRGTLFVHMKGGETGYFTVKGYSEAKLLSRLAPWCRKVGIPVGPSTPDADNGVADELAKLATLRDQGVLTSKEFDAQKARLLNP